MTAADPVTAPVDARFGEAIRPPLKRRLIPVGVIALVLAYLVYSVFYFNVPSVLGQARGDLIDDGYPPEAWAAYVLIGDGRRQPVPERPIWPPLAWIAAGLVLAGVGFGRWRRD